MSDLWVFGYGSLLWNPGFAPEETVAAHVDGLHRSLCIYSWVHRGTPQRPGLVFGLDKGGSCNGMALKVAGHEREKVLQYLRDRELVTNVYLEEIHKAQLVDGRKVDVVAYVVDQAHEQYAGKLSHDDLVRFVRQGKGQSGKNVDYIVNTVAHLQELGIGDEVLENLVEELKSTG